MDLKEAIHARHSTRKFVSEPVPASVMEKLTEICAVPDPIDGEHARINIVNKAVGGKIGTYGVISGAGHFLVLCYTEGDALAPVNAGMKMEQVVLWLTAHGVATCWLGGTFSAGDAAKAASPTEGETIPAVVAFGIGAKNDTLFSHLTKWMAKSKQRKPFDELFEASTGSPFHAALEMMRLAPSSLNSQPWRAVATDKRVDFYTTKATDGARMDLGIGLCHFALTAPAGQWTSADAPVRDGWHYIISYTMNQRDNVK